MKVGAEVLEEEISKIELNGRVACIDVKGALQAGVLGLFGGAIYFGIQGAVAGSVVFPIVGTVTGGVGSAVVGGEFGFFGGVGQAIISDFLFNC